MRWLTAVLVWLTMRALWPDRRREAVFIALLFTISPSFTQQAIAVTYSLVWTQYVLYLLSWLWMIMALRGAGNKPILLAGSLISLAVSFSLSEYFFGLELLRPFVLWLVLSDELPAQSPEQRRRWFLAWLPYLIVDVLYLLLRIFVFRYFLAPGAVRLNPKLLGLLADSPLAGLWRLIQLAVPDVLQALAGTWTDIMQPSKLQFGQSISYISAAIALLAGGLTVYLLHRLQPPASPPAPADGAFVKQAVLLGLAMTVLGSAPAWVIERQATIGRFSDRFALVAMLGASIALVGILSWFTQRDIGKVLTIGLLVMLGINYHVAISNGYRHAWERERLFYWQLYWRTPGLSPGTAIIADSEVIPYAGIYSSSLGINLIYSKYEHRPAVDYWIFTADNELQGHLPAYRAGRRFDVSFRAWSFNTKSNDNLVISNGPDQCVHILGPAESDLEGAPEVLQPYLARSDLSRVLLDESQRPPMPIDIFGAEPEHGWCYYYEKGSLAAQQGAWQTAANLEKQAGQLGLEPADPWEWLVFIEANIRTGDFGRARDLTLQAGEERNDLGTSLCGLWTRTNSSSADFQNNLAAIKASLGCAP
jgi:hypothetical protein